VGAAAIGRMAAALEAPSSSAPGWEAKHVLHLDATAGAAAVAEAAAALLQSCGWSSALVPAPHALQASESARAAQLAAAARAATSAQLLHQADCALRSAVSSCAQSSSACRPSAALLCSAKAAALASARALCASGALPAALGWPEEELEGELQPAAEPAQMAQPAPEPAQTTQPAHLLRLRDWAAAELLRHIASLGPPAIAAAAPGPP
jgi:hypothetical protein